MKQLKTIIWSILGIAYFPVFVAFWLLTFVARILLAISYAGQLDFRRAKDIMQTTFSIYGYGYIDRF